MSKNWIISKVDLYNKCENMEQLYDNYYVPLQQELSKKEKIIDELKEYIDMELCTTKKCFEELETILGGNNE